MGNVEFAWDRRKARTNLAKHGVSLEEAESVFLDESARLIDDPIILGMKIGSCCWVTAFRRVVSSSATATGSPILLSG